MAFLTEEKKRRLRLSPLWPALVSGLVAPGLGQILNREPFKGAFLLFSFVGSILWFSKIVGQRLLTLLPGSPEQWAQDPAVMREAVVRLATDDPKSFLMFDVLILLVWGFSVVDAYLTAKKRNAKGTHESDHAAR